MGIVIFRKLHCRTDKRFGTRARQVVIIHGIISTAFGSIMTRIASTTVLAIISLKRIEKKLNTQMVEIFVTNSLFSETSWNNVNQQELSISLTDNIGQRLIESRSKASYYYSMFDDTKWKTCLYVNVLDDNNAVLDAIMFTASAIFNLRGSQSFCYNGCLVCQPPFFHYRYMTRRRSRHDQRLSSSVALSIATQKKSIFLDPIKEEKSRTSALFICVMGGNSKIICLRKVQGIVNNGFWT